MLKAGLKVFTSDPVKMLEERAFADYIEVMAVPGIPADKFKDFDMEYIIHAPHLGQGVNLASRKDQAFSLDAVRQALKAADILNAKIVILHAGSSKSRLGSGDTSEETLADSLTKLADDRIVIENLPLRDNVDRFYPYDYQTVSRYASFFGKRICLDFSHANTSALNLSIGLSKMIDELQRLDVRVFHLCDGDTSQAVDQHKSLFTGNFDLEGMKKTILKSSCKRVTLETPLDIIKQKAEYDWLKS